MKIIVTVDALLTLLFNTLSLCSPLSVMNFCIYMAQHACWLRYAHAIRKIFHEKLFEGFGCNFIASGLGSYHL